MIDPSQMGGPPAMMPEGTPPEMMDQGAMPGPQMGASLDPGSLAEIAMRAIAEAAQMDQAMFEQTLEQARMEFAARQEASIGAAMPAMQAIIAQLGQAPPETMDAGAMPMPVEEELDSEMLMDPQAGPIG